MQEISFEDWQRWSSEGYTHVPVTRSLPMDAPPSTWGDLATAPTLALLESAQSGRYTYICDRAERVIIGQEQGANLTEFDSAVCSRFVAGKPLDVLASLLKERAVPKLAGWPPMMGGLIGLLGYDLVRTWECLPVRATRDLELPLYAMIEPRVLLVFDSLERVLRVVAWRNVSSADTNLRAAYDDAASEAAAALARWRNECPVVSNIPKTSVPDPATRATTFSDDAFKAAIRQAQSYIGAGDTYQVNLSRRTSQPTSLKPEMIYDALRRVNPSPYMGLFKLPEFSLVCGSPELLVRLVDGVISSRPIAGTRPRGAAAGEDSSFSAELLASDKERAEHLMLVDLIRNDIGRVAKYGSVQVREFMALERYSHVMHIVSQVEGELAAGRSWTEVVQSMFPGGTITGCPKIRTMEIIEELEPVGRGYYTGALGWISYYGQMELNIVIRSMLLKNNTAYVQAGAGIVADSEPDREVDEATRKAQALWVALDRATESHG